MTSGRLGDDGSFPPWRPVEANAAAASQAAQLRGERGRYVDTGKWQKAKPDLGPARPHQHDWLAWTSEGGSVVAVQCVTCKALEGPEWQRGRAE